MNHLRVYMPFGGEAYMNFLKKRFNIKVVTNIKKEFPHLVFFTGGADVDPSLYGEKVGDYTSINKARDTKEVEVFQYCLSNGIPMLGICRGAQFLCVNSGGKLIQHVTGHAIGGTHKITEESEEFGERVFEITSTHHQMMYPYNLRSNDYGVIAHSTLFLSNMYLNGDNENLSVAKDFLEPEIVDFFNTRSLAIQGHPEANHCPKRTVDYTLDLIQHRFNFNNFIIEK